MSKERHIHHRSWVNIGLFLALSPVLTIVSAAQPEPSIDWAHFSAPLANGGRYEWSAMHDQATLFAFIDIASNDNNSASRAETVILQSLDHQYRHRGVTVIAIDSRVGGAYSNSTHSSLMKGIASWYLNFPVLEDRDGTDPRKAGVRVVPTMILVSKSGEEIGRWEGFTRTPILAQSVERIVGGPLGGLPDAATKPESFLGTGAR